jgi:hypothetical protein
MRRKGYRRDPNPEKMPVITTGIQMSRDSEITDRGERLTGGNAGADESQVAKLVCDFIISSR